MTIHKEGYKIILVSFILLTIIGGLLCFLLPNFWFIRMPIIITFSVLFLLVLQFFRSPKRNVILDDQLIISPADGKVVVIEEVFEPEFFNEKRIQVSIFMSPLNVHLNRYPIKGLIKYFKYHPGKYLVAWHPKASSENERTTVVVEQTPKNNVLFRQIAGAVARRIVCYAKENQNVLQGSEAGFIKFGSRVDIFMPLGTQIKVKLGDKVKAGINVIAEFR